MKRTILVVLLAAGFAAQGGLRTLAQAAPNDSDKPATQEESNDKGTKEPKPERPPVVGLKAELLDSLTQGFQEKVADYQAKQKDVLSALKSAKGEERERLRGVLKTLQQEMKDQKARFKDEVKDATEKLKDLKGKLDEEVREERDRNKPRDR